ncbi:MAG: hypothetical protein ACYTAO_07695 [Planctomycetota bacterium]|jgi:hypothetical protein
MQKKKIALIVSVVVLVVAVGVLLRGSFLSSTPSRRQLGLSSLSATDENGDKWVLELVKGQPLSDFRDSSARRGAPLLIKTDVQIVGRDVSIGLIVEGQAGETYVPGVQKNGQWQPAPGLKIVDEAGNTLGTGKFKYG